MKKIIIIILLIWVSISIHAQLSYVQNTDTLKWLINSGKDDTIRAQRLMNLGILYVYNNPDSGLKYGNQMLQLSRQINYQQGIGDAYTLLSSAHEVLGNYSVAMSDAFEAMKIFELLDNTNDIARVSYSIGDIYWQLGDYKQALSYYYKGRDFIKSVPDSLNNKRNDLKIESRMYSDASLAAAYLLGNMLDSALIFAKSAFAADRAIDRYWSFAPLVLGNSYLKLKEYDSALKYYRSEVRVHAQNDQIDVNNGIATIFKMRNQFDSCSFYAQKALDTAQLIKYTRGVMDASELLSWVYEKINPVEAIRYYKINREAKDSLFNREKISQINILVFNEELHRQELKNADVKYQNKIRIYGLLAIVAISLLVAIFLYRNNRHRQKAFRLLQRQKGETDLQKAKVENTLEELKTTQAQLIQSEKMASLGELTAGIAHEIQNPLNFINNFSEVNTELIDEMHEEIDTGNFQGIKSIANDIKENEEKINHHGRRADAIVKSMLQHSGGSAGHKELTDINALADEYLRLSYHGLRAKDKLINITLKTDFDPGIGKMNIVPQDIGRVLLNLYNNAFYAATLSAKGQSNEPTVWVSTKKTGDKVLISVRDNGPGIPQKIVDKIFQPFFTTKPTGQGTGLGLSLSYDIVKAHNGDLKVETKEGEGSEFIVELPGV